MILFFAVELPDRMVTTRLEHVKPIVWSLSSDLVVSRLYFTEDRVGNKLGSACLLAAFAVSGQAPAKT